LLKGGGRLPPFWLHLYAVLSHFVWPDIMDTVDVKIFGKSEIIVNINEIHPLENAQQLENFALMFGTANGQGTILAVQIGQPELNRIFGDVLIIRYSVVPFHEMMICSTSNEPLDNGMVLWYIYPKPDKRD